MTPETLEEIARLLHQARKLLPEPPPLEDEEIAEIHRRILGLDTAVRNLAAKRARETRKPSPRP